MASASIWNRLSHWFGGRTPPADTPQPTELPRASPAAPPAPVATTEVRGLRAQRREQLFGLVREQMIRSGVLSSAYRFKALTLDKSGTQFLVLMDVQTDSVPHDPAHLAKLESTLQKTAQDTLQLEVKSVYWRLVGGSTSTAPTLAPRKVPRNDFAPTQPMVHDDLDDPHLSETQYAQLR